MDLATLSASLESSQKSVSLHHIIVSLTNPRQTFNAEKMAALTESVRQHGVIQPVLLRPLSAEAAFERNTMALYELVSGERRFRAAKDALLLEIPALIRPLTDAQACELQIIENLQREDVSEIEESDGYQMMVEELGYTVDELAEKIGKSRGYIYGRLKLQALCPLVRKATYDGKLSASVALLIARIPVPSLQEKALKAVTLDPSTCEPMSARKAKQHITDNFTLQMSRAHFDLASTDLIPLAGACDGCQKRTTCNRDAFPDISADVCTDPDCFKAKDAAHVERIKNNYADAGHRVLSHDESLPLMWYGNAIEPKEDSNLVLLEEPSGYDQDKTWRELLEGVDVALTILENSSGNLIECIERSALTEALTRAGIVTETNDQDHNRNQLDDPKNDPYKAEKEARALKEKQDKQNIAIGEALRPLVVSSISAHLAGGGCAHDDDVRLVARIMLAEKIEDGGAPFKNIAHRHFENAIVMQSCAPEDIDDEATGAQALAIVDSMDPNSLFALTLDLALHTHTQWSFVSKHNTAALEACATRYGINVAQVRAEITGEPAPETASEPDSAPDSLAAKVASTPDEAAQAQEENAAEEQKSTAAIDDWPFAAPTSDEETAPPPDKAAQAQEAKPAKSKKAGATPEVKYTNPLDARQTWTGRGRKPQWVVEALAGGKTLQDLEVKPQAAPAKGKAKGKSNIKAASAAKTANAKALDSGRKAAGGKKKPAPQAAACAKETAERCTRTVDALGGEA